MAATRAPERARTSSASPTWSWCWWVRTICSTSSTCRPSAASAGPARRAPRPSAARDRRASAGRRRAASSSRGRRGTASAARGGARGRAARAARARSLPARRSATVRRVPPEDRVVPRFAAEPPQDQLPYGGWAQRLQEEFLAACLRVEGDGEDLGEPGEIAWYPDRTWHGRTFVPATAQTSTGPRALRLRRASPTAATTRIRTTSTRSPTSRRRRPRPTRTGGSTSPTRSSARGAASAARPRR